MADAFRSFQFGERKLACDGSVHVMGIVNVTPDSFSDGGRFAGVETAVARGLELAAAGAAILDIGGESTRPGHVAVDPAVETARVVPVIAELSRQTAVPISIDTSKAMVAEAALAAGAVIINDVTGFARDEAAMAELIRTSRAGCIVMHGLELPGNGQAEGAVAARMVEDYLAERVCRLTALTGLTRAFFAVDPGIGFGKDWRQNLALIRHLADLRRTGCAVLLAPSRKRFIGQVTGVEKPSARDWGTAGAVAAGALLGADIVRVHEVAPMREVLAVATAIALSP